MDAAEATKEIADLNLTYMLLAQKLLREDRASAMLRLGMGAEMANLLAGMSLAEVIKLAASHFVLCAFRLDEQPALRNVVQGERQASLQQAHLSILLAVGQN
ncbi:MAG: flagellar transcriptional regulator FlhD, partial [Ramlibacter sp.]|nr:flagellar transcriptional regulator FlhD [Ramlibacter sp.]